MRRILYLFIFLVPLFSCSNKIEHIENNSIKGDWAFIETSPYDSSEIYQELSITEGTIYIYSFVDEFQRKYALKNDTLFIFLPQSDTAIWNAKMESINDSIAIFSNSENKYTFHKIDTSFYTLSERIEHNNLINLTFRDKRGLGSKLKSEIEGYYRVRYNIRQILFDLKVDKIDFHSAKNLMSEYLSEDYPDPDSEYQYKRGLDMILEIENNKR